MGKTAGRLEVTNVVAQALEGITATEGRAIRHCRSVAFLYPDLLCGDHFTLVGPGVGIKIGVGNLGNGIGTLVPRDGEVLNGLPAGCPSSRYLDVILLLRIIDLKSLGPLHLREGRQLEISLAAESQFHLYTLTGLHGLVKSIGGEPEVADSSCKIIGLGHGEGLYIDRKGLGGHLFPNPLVGVKETGEEVIGIIILRGNSHKKTEGT